jgi:hypothetical protein
VAVGARHVTLTVDAALPLISNLGLLPAKGRVTIKAGIHALSPWIDNRGWDWFAWRGWRWGSRNLTRLVTGLANIIGATNMIVGNLGRAANPLLVTGQAVLTSDERVRDKRWPAFRDWGGFRRDVTFQTILAALQGVGHW